MDTFLRAATGQPGAFVADMGLIHAAWHDIASVLGAIILVAISAFFVISEYSLIKARPTRLDELASSGSYGARIARQAVGHLDSYLSATQLGITITTLLLGKYGEPAMDQLLSPVFHRIPLPAAWGDAVAFFLSLFVVTGIQVIYGEQVPKYIAIDRAERIAILTAPIVHIFYRMTYPLVLALAALTRGSLTPFGIRPGQSNSIHTAQEIGMIVSSSERGGAVGQAEAEMARNAIIIGDRDARDIMVPRVDMVYLTTSATVAENVSTANRAGFTRFPLCDPDPDHVIGMVHIKDLLAISGKEDATIRDARRDILVVPETKPLDALLREFQTGRVHMALVLDEYGGTAGIVTLEDVIEEIVGDIQDEHQSETPEVERAGEHAYLVDGGLTLDDLSRDQGIDLNADEADTVGGYLQWRLGAVPETGQEVSADGYILRVEAMEGRRIRRVLIARMHPHRSEKTVDADR